MKKLILLFSLISITSFAQYDSSAIAYFNIVTDINPLAKQAISDRITAFKSNGTWDSLKACLISAPTLNSINALIDLKNLNNISKYCNSVGTQYVSPYNETLVYPSMDGYCFAGGFIKTGLIPSNIMKLNNSAIAIGTLNNEAGNNGYNFGALNSTSQDIVFNNRNTSNQCFADMYNSTSAAGRNIATGANGNKGVKIINRQSSTSFRLNDNGSIHTITGSGGSLPTIEIYLNKCNGSGSARNTTINFFCVYGTGLTSSQETQEINDWKAFSDSLGRDAVYDKNFVVDGNSFTQYYMGKVSRTIAYSLYGNNWKHSNIGVSGQTTAQVITRQPTKLKPLYDASCSKNIYVLIEITNEMYLGASLATCEANLIKACDTAKAYGFKVICVPMYARNYVSNVAGLSQTNWNLRVDSMNVFVRDIMPSHCDTVCTLSTNYFDYRSNFGSDALYNTYISNILSNTTYFQTDKLHLTELGFYELGIEIYDKSLGL